jgi:hypothetical protein
VPANRLHNLRLGPAGVCLQGKEGCERRAHVSAREGFVLSKGADGTACECDVGELSSECVVPVSSLGDRLEFVDMSGDLTLDDIEMNAGPCTKLCNNV